MGEFTTIMARDGHEFQAYLSPARGRSRGASVVLQEIFGVNSQIRSVADHCSEAGYTSIAPAMFDRVRRGIELGYTPETMQEGMGYVKQLPRSDVARIRAANPDAEVYTYPADHGFSNDQRGCYEPASAALAQQRALDFFARRIAQEKPAS